MKAMILLLSLFISTCLFAQVPFNRDKQPAPSGTDWNSMIPAHIGAFTRIAFQLPEPNNDGTAYYIKGKQIIYVSFMLLKDERQVDEYMKVAKGDLLRSSADTRKVDFSGTNKYVYYSQKDKAFFAWTRGNYYFDVMIEGDVSQLNEFMSSFPY